MNTLLSIDQSTSGTKAVLWTLSGERLARADVPHRQITDAQGWVEHDPREILRGTLEAARQAIAEADVDAASVRAIGIANQRETAVCWDARTGQPLYNAIVWQCARATDVVADIAAAGMAEPIRARTGLPLSVYFTAPKIGWMLRHVPDVRAARDRGTLRCGTVDAWLIHNLTGRFATDVTNASRTQLLDLAALRWDPDIAAAFGIPLACLPEIRPSDADYGETDLGGLLPKPVPLHGVLGDSHAALFANRCWAPFEAKATYGTGSSVMMNVGTARPQPNPGIAASVAFGVGGETHYALEGNINDAGSVIQWLAHGLGLLPDAKSAGSIAAEVEDAGGVYLVPAFSGLGAPYFNDRARAAFVGMNRGTTRAHLVRAAEECIAYQVRDIWEAMREGLPGTTPVLHVDGGPTRVPLLMQFQADMLGVPLAIGQAEEASARGAAFCAALGAGLCAREAFAMNEQEIVQPRMDERRRAALYDGWRRAVRMIDRGYE